jgi:replicative superfamily II helicase
MTSTSTDRRDSFFRETSRKKKKIKDRKEVRKNWSSSLIFVEKEYAEFEEESRAITPKEVGAETIIFGYLLC